MSETFNGAMSDTPLVETREVRDFNEAACVLKSAFHKVREERNLAQGEHIRACQMIAAMHEAAVGSARGPIGSSPVADVANLKAAYDTAIAMIESLTRPTVRPTVPVIIVCDSSVESPRTRQARAQNIAEKSAAVRRVSFVIAVMSGRPIRRNAGPWIVMAKLDETTPKERREPWVCIKTGAQITLSREDYTAVDWEVQP